MITLAISMLAFAGSTLEYRRLLSFCSPISSILGTILLSVSVAYYVNANAIDQSIASNWETIRLILPPTLQARYDRDRFVALTKANMKALAYAGALTGCTLLLASSLCLTAAKYVSVYKRQLANDLQDVKMSETTAAVDESASTIVYDSARQRRQEVSLLKNRCPVSCRGLTIRTLSQWFAVFEPSKRRQRIVMKLVALIVVLLVTFIFAIMCANVVFAVKCNSIGKLVKSDGYSLMQPGDQVNTTQAISIRDTFTRGLVSVSASNASSGHVDLRVYGTEVRTFSFYT